MNMKVTIFPYREKVGMGNIMWEKHYEMRGGKFPVGHPVGGGFCTAGASQSGDGENIKSFRALGYWASCFPEGDGITWKPLQGQSDAKCMEDIQTAFGWDALWGIALTKDNEEAK